MGDAADQALERAEVECELFDRLQDAPFEEQYDAGLIDETGATIGRSNSYPGRRRPPKGLWDM